MPITFSRPHLFKPDDKNRAAFGSSMTAGSLTADRLQRGKSCGHNSGAKRRQKDSAIRSAMGRFRQTA